MVFSFVLCSLKCVKVTNNNKVPVIQKNHYELSLTCLKFYTDLVLRINEVLSTRMNVSKGGQKEEEGETFHRFFSRNCIQKVIM